MTKRMKEIAAQWFGRVFAGANGRPEAPVMRIDIRGEAGADEAEILIYDDIGESFWAEGVTAAGVIEQLEAIDAQTINVRINSYGGQVFEGLGIFNALERHPARVVTHVDGIAASIASIIALAGDEVRMAKNALLMIHNPHGGVLGEAKDMRKMADTLDKVAASLVGVYARRTGKKVAEIQAWMDEETYFDADEALEYGFIDQVSEKRSEEAKGVARPKASARSEIGLTVASLEGVLSALPVAEPAASEPEPVAAGPDPEVIRVAAESQRVLMETVRR